MTSIPSDVPRGAPTVAVVACGGVTLWRPHGASQTWRSCHVGQQLPLPVHVLIPVGAAASLRLVSGAKLDLASRTIVGLASGRVSLFEGHLRLRVGRQPIRVEALDRGSVVVLRGTVRMGVVAGAARLLVDDGLVVNLGRSHRAGSSLRWERGATPALGPWARGTALPPGEAGRVPDEPVRQARRDLEAALARARGRAPRWDRLLTLWRAWERGVAKELLRRFDQGPFPGRHLVAAWVMERGTAAQQVRLVDGLSFGEAVLLRDLLAARASGAASELQQASVAALARAGEFGWCEASDGARARGTSHGSDPAQTVVHADEAGRRTRLQQALAMPWAPWSSRLLEALAREGWPRPALERALGCRHLSGLPHLGARPAPSSGIRPSDVPQALTALRPWVRAWEEVRRRLEEAALEDGSAAAWAIVLDLRTRRGLEVLRRALESGPDLELPGVVRRLDAFLGRTVSPDERAAVGARAAAIQLLDLLLPTWQPPGEDLFLLDLPEVW